MTRSTTKRSAARRSASNRARSAPGTSRKPPGTFRDFVRKFPALGRAHESVAKAVERAGPLDYRTCELIKIGISLGAGLESAVRSHVRRASEQGASDAEIEQAILLAMNTCGLPRTVAAWQWAHQQFDRDRAEQMASD